MRGSSFALLATLAAALPACHKKVTKDDCTRMLDRYLDMVIASDPTTQTLSPAQLTAVREMKRAVKKGEKSYMQVEAQCEREVSVHEYDCAMDAHVPDEWEACIE